MNKKKYWDTYYQTKNLRTNIPTVPSQFAAFISGEFWEERPVIVEIGCGNGRDSLFFAKHGFSVIGVDSSIEAINKCNENTDEHSIFICSDINNLGLEEQIREISQSGYSVVVYARFFLHAIDLRTEHRFLEFAKNICGANGVVALEFRSNRDEALSKVTDKHFRRFIKPVSFIERAASHGFKSRYFVEGFGFAKFNEDDAHVVRVILQLES